MIRKNNFFQRTSLYNCQVWLLRHYVFNISRAMPFVHKLYGRIGLRVTDRS